MNETLVHARTKIISKILGIENYQIIFAPP
jgi:hypothetical protein